MKISNLNSEEIASRLILTVINYKENVDKLNDFPFIRKGSFALLAQICIGEKNDAGQYTACLTVTNEMLQNWGFDKNRMIEIAADNSNKLFQPDLQPILNYIDNKTVDIDSIKEQDEMNVENVTVVTNKQHYNGAAVMFYAPDVLYDLAKKSEVRQMALMASSVNQIYCIPITEHSSREECSDLYKTMLEELPDQNALADNVLIYDSQSRMITEEDGQTYSPEINSTVVHRQEHRR